MKQIDRYTLKVIREHKNARIKTPIWELMPISKCWIGLPKIQYVIWWGKSILDYCDNYKDAVRRRREIYNLA
jgi:hypothetical protein